MGVVIGEEAVFGVKLGHPTVTNGTLLRTCVELREPIELSFGVVSGLGSGVHVLDGAHLPREGWILGSFATIGPMVSIAYFVTEMYSTYA